MHRMVDWWGLCAALASSSPYLVLLNDLLLIPIWHYVLAFLTISFAFLYYFLEFHFLHDLFTGFRGCPVTLTYHSSSHIYHDVVSKCRILHSRYLVTPWLSSPHVQTAFLSIFGRPPLFNYRRQLFHLSDGGTIALDWLLNSDVLGNNFDITTAIPKDDINPIVLAIPGMTSDSESPSIKHLAFNTAQKGWNVVVTNHRGLGGVSITGMENTFSPMLSNLLVKKLVHVYNEAIKQPMVAGNGEYFQSHASSEAREGVKPVRSSDCFYDAGWTEDLRAVINHLHHEYPNAPLFVVGMSMGANILVKYLGEDGDSIPVAGAVAICSPWDLLISDRFLHRRLLQKIYERVLAIGLQDYVQLHRLIFSRLANWEGIKKSRSIRDFDHHAIRLLGKFETVDTYYRHCSSASYVGNVSVPLLCISALDDPVCTWEAIPWDECRANLNIVLATTKRGGHLAFFEGLTATGIWWVRAVDEFLKVLHCSQHMHVKKVASSYPPLIIEPGEGKISAERDQQRSQPKSDTLANVVQSSEQATMPLDVIAHARRCLDLLSQQSRWPLWLLVYTAIMTSWPMVGSVLQIALQKKLRNVLPDAFLKT